MIRLKDLQNRVYSGKSCIRFEYEFDVDQNKTIVAVFKKLTDNANTWKMSIVLRV